MNKNGEIQTIGEILGPIMDDMAKHYAHCEGAIPVQETDKLTDEERAEYLTSQSTSGIVKTLGELRKSNKI